MRATPGVSVVVALQPMVTSPARPTVVPPGFPQPSTGSVNCSSVPLTIPAVSTPEKSLLFQAAEMDQHQPWSGSSFGGESVGRHLPPASLTPRLAAASPHVGESDADGGRSGVPDLSRERPFDVHQDRPHSGASPRLLQGTQGCPFWMTSYDEEHSGPDFTPAYGVQLHDPRLLEYVGAPESARLLSRIPRSVAVSYEHYASGDALLPSSPGGALHDGNGFVAATCDAGDTGTSAIGDVQHLHVMQ